MKTSRTLPVAATAVVLAGYTAGISSNAWSNTPTFTRLLRPDLVVPGMAIHEFQGWMDFSDPSPGTGAYVVPPSGSIAALTPTQSDIEWADSIAAEGSVIGVRRLSVDLGSIGSALFAVANPKWLDVADALGVSAGVRTSTFKVTDSANGMNAFWSGTLDYDGEITRGSLSYSGRALNGVFSLSDRTLVVDGMLYTGADSVLRVAEIVPADTFMACGEP